MNLEYGWCALNALGSFDYTKSGHLILWDLKMAIKLLAGSTILIPSATLVHSNAAGGKDQTPRSIAQYSAGGLFRMADCGYTPLSLFTKVASPETVAKYKMHEKANWQFGTGFAAGRQRCSMKEHG